MDLVLASLGFFLGFASLAALVAGIREARAALRGR